VVIQDEDFDFKQDDSSDQFSAHYEVPVSGFQSVRSFVAQLSCFENLKCQLVKH
jgi:hypothetical protein